MTSVEGALARVRTPRPAAAAPQVEVVSFTDPYCSWCWALEPVLLRVRETYGAQVRFETVMGGLVQEAPPLVDDPARLAWLRDHLAMVSRRTGQPIDLGLIQAAALDAFSTWPACIYVKAAYLQGGPAGDAYLRRMRRAIMTERCNASDRQSALVLADEVAGLDAMQMRNDLADGSALQAFLRDRSRCEDLGVTGFPTLVVRLLREPAMPRAIVGYRPFAEVDRVLRAVAPHLVAHEPPGMVNLASVRGPLTTRELTESQGGGPDAEKELQRLARHGELRRMPVEGGELWASK